MEDLLADEDALDILENNARIAVEALLDVGRFTAAAMGWEPPSSYREVARILGAHGVLSPGEARLLASLAGFRNVIVHMYAELDYWELAGILDMLDELEHLMARMLGFLEERGVDP